MTITIAKQIDQDKKKIVAAAAATNDRSTVQPTDRSTVATISIDDIYLFSHELNEREFTTRKSHTQISSM